MQDRLEDGQQPRPPVPTEILTNVLPRPRHRSTRQRLIHQRTGAPTRRSAWREGVKTPQLPRSADPAHPRYTSAGSSETATRWRRPPPVCTHGMRSAMPPATAIAIRLPRCENFYRTDSSKAPRRRCESCGVTMGRCLTCRDRSSGVDHLPGRRHKHPCRSDGRADLEFYRSIASSAPTAVNESYATPRHFNVPADVLGQREFHVHGVPGDDRVHSRLRHRTYSVC